MASKPADNTQEPLFDLPDEAQEPLQLSDLAGHLMFFRPTATKKVDTSFGASDVTVADIVAVQPNGKLLSMPDTYIFWRGVNEQLSSKLGSGRWVAGILRQGAGKNSKAWSLGAPSAVEQGRLADIINSGEFREIVNGLNEEPF